MGDDLKLLIYGEPKAGKTTYAGFRHAQTIWQCDSCLADVPGTMLDSASRISVMILCTDCGEVLR